MHKNDIFNWIMLCIYAHEYCEGFSNFKIILILNENVKNVNLDIIFLLLVCRLVLVEKARIRLVLV